MEECFAKKLFVQDALEQIWGHYKAFCLAPKKD
jgi:hypothetical protein